MDNYNQPSGSGLPQEGNMYAPLEVDQNGKMNLAEAAKWAKFLGVLGIVFLALMVFGALSLMIAGSAILENSPELQALPVSGALLGIFYTIIALINVYPVWALYKFGAQMRRSVQEQSQEKFGEALAHLKGFFKFIGILSLIIIIIYGVAIVAAALGMGVLGSMR